MAPPKKLAKLQIDCLQKDCDLIQGVLACRAAQGWQEEDLPDSGTTFRLFYENPEHAEKLAAEIAEFAPDCRSQIAWEEIPDPLEAWREFFTPVTCGSRFVVLPPWLKDSTSTSAHKIIIEPKSAFGTGHHASTALCLTALDWLAEKNRLDMDKRFLDLGCGSGILGIAASKLGMAGLGMDIDPIAIANAMENRELNNACQLDLKEGSDQDLPKENFGLIFANILAGPLTRMAPDLTSSLESGGWLILSGILSTQAQAVKEKYEACNLKLSRGLEDGEWACLIFQKN